MYRFLFLIFCAASSSAFAQHKWENPWQEFQRDPEVEYVEATFKFTNTGSIPLIISGASSSCGCTVPKWPEEPIPPGGTGEISAKFNTEGKHNAQKKMIQVTANTYPNETSVTLKGMVLPKK